MVGRKVAVLEKAIETDVVPYRRWAVILLAVPAIPILTPVHQIVVINPLRNAVVLANIK